MKIIDLKIVSILCICTVLSACEVSIPLMDTITDTTTISSGTTGVETEVTSVVEVSTNSMEEVESIVETSTVNVEESAETDIPNTVLSEVEESSIITTSLPISQESTSLAITTSKRVTEPSIITTTMETIATTEKPEKTQDELTDEGWLKYAQSYYKNLCGHTAEEYGLDSGRALDITYCMITPLTRITSNNKPSSLVSELDKIGCSSEVTKSDVVIADSPRGTHIEVDFKNKTMSYIPYYGSDKVVRYGRTDNYILGIFELKSDKPLITWENLYNTDELMLILLGQTDAVGYTQFNQVLSEASNDIEVKPFEAPVLKTNQDLIKEDFEKVISLTDLLSFDYVSEKAGELVNTWGTDARVSSDGIRVKFGNRLNSNKSDALSVTYSYTDGSIDTIKYMVYTDKNDNSKAYIISIQKTSVDKGYTYSIKSPTGEALDGVNSVDSLKETFEGIIEKLGV